jgi:hypothetical protein
LWSCYWGQHDSSWIAFYAFCEHIGVKYKPATSRHLQLWSEVAQSSCWWWPYRGLVIASERPTAVHMEPVSVGARELQLHHDTGPALLFADGWPVHAWHGVRVPAKVIEAPDTLTVGEITSYANVEVRRVMLERFGTERYLHDAGATQVCVDDWGTLWQADLPNDEPLVMVEVLNSSPEPDGTFKTYFLRVPPSVRTAHQAVAWTFGMNKSEYRPLVQT